MSSFLRHFIFTYHHFHNHSTTHNIDGDDISIIDKKTFGCLLIENPEMTSLSKCFPNMENIIHINNITSLNIELKGKTMNNWNWGYSSISVIYPDLPYVCESFQLTKETRDNKKKEDKIVEDKICELCIKIIKILLDIIKKIDITIWNVDEYSCVFRLLIYLIKYNHTNTSSTKFLSSFFTSSSNSISISPGNHFHTLFINILEKGLKKGISHFGVDNNLINTKFLSGLTFIYRLLETLISLTEKDEIFCKEILSIYKNQNIIKHLILLFNIPSNQQQQQYEAVDNEMYSYFSFLYTLNHNKHFTIIKSDFIFNCFTFHFEAFCSLFKYLIRSDTIHLFPCTSPFIPAIHQSLIHVTLNTKSSTEDDIKLLSLLLKILNDIKNINFDNLYLLSFITSLYSPTKPLSDVWEKCVNIESEIVSFQNMTILSTSFNEVKKECRKYLNECLKCVKPTPIIRENIEQIKTPQNTVIKYLFKVDEQKQEIRGMMILKKLLNKELLLNINKINREVIELEALLMFLEKIIFGCYIYYNNFINQNIEILRKNQEVIEALINQRSSSSSSWSFSSLPTFSNLKIESQPTHTHTILYLLYKSILLPPLSNK
jgi:hypothetical protein